VEDELDPRILFHVTSTYGLINYFKNAVYMINNGNNYMCEEDFFVKYLCEIICGSSVVLDIGAHAGSHTVV